MTAERQAIRRAYAFAAVFVLALVAACAGNGEGLDQNGRPATNAVASLTANYESIQANVFTPNCTVCHSGAAAPEGLRLDANNSYALLVGVASSEVPGLLRVQAGNPNASYLLQKIIGSAAVGDRMPLGGPYLAQSTIDVISHWIANGALRSPSTTAVGLHVVTAPYPDATITAPQPQLVIGFNRDLDATLVNDTTVTLQETDTGEPVAIILSVPSTNPSTLLVTPLNALPTGAYRLSLRGSGGGALADMNAQPLNARPDSAQGSDFITTFTIKAEL